MYEFSCQLNFTAEGWGTEENENPFEQELGWRGAGTWKYEVPAAIGLIPGFELLFDSCAC